MILISIEATLIIAITPAVYCIAAHTRNKSSFPFCNSICVGVLSFGEESYFQDNLLSQVASFARTTVGVLLFCAVRYSAYSDIVSPFLQCLDGIFSSVYQSSFPKSAFRKDMKSLRNYYRSTQLFHT